MTVGSIDRSRAQLTDPTSPRGLHFLSDHMLFQGQMGGNRVLCKSKSIKNILTMMFFSLFFSATSTG